MRLDNRLRNIENSIFNLLSDVRKLNEFDTLSGNSLLSSCGNSCKHHNIDIMIASIYDILEESKTLKSEIPLKQADGFYSLDKIELTALQYRFLLQRRNDIVEADYTDAELSVMHGVVETDIKGRIYDIYRDGNDIYVYVDKYHRIQVLS